MKKVFLITLMVIGAFMLSNCGKETVVERVEVRKGNLILSGYGAPQPRVGEIGDYYINLTTVELYGAKNQSG